MRLSGRLLTTPLLAALASLPSLLAASAEEVSLRTRYSPGDGYVLALSAVRNSELLARAETRRPHREDVHLRYEANVVVLETDGAGIPVRERHQDVVLSFVRPDEAGSLFAENTSYEVRRQDGALQILANGERAEAAIERVVGELLQGQFEYGLGALLDPGRTVETGASWELEPARVRAFLRSRGVERARLDGPAIASLDPRATHAVPLVVRYRIPIASFAPSRLPPNGRTARSQGSLEGEVRLQPEAQREPLRHSSKLALRMHGTVFGHGVARSFPWSLSSSEALDQHTLTLRREVAAR
jgi:hypothetical protein